MLEIDNAALIIIDVQGKLASIMYQKDELYQNLIKIIKGAQALELPIIWNEQIPDKLGPTIPEIANILQDMKPLAKTTFSCCGNSDFQTKLEKSGRKQVLMVGIETHVCVYQTAIDLLRAGYEVYLVADAVSSRTVENKVIGIQAIKDAGAKITSVEMALFEMLKVAQGDKFKQVIKIVK